MANAEGQLTRARPAARTRRSTDRRDRLLPWIGMAIFLGLFEAATRLDVLPQQFVPPPTVIALALVEILGRPSFLWAAGDTLLSWMASFALAAALAVPVGILMGVSRYVHAALGGIVEFLRPIPSVALIPAIILLLGANFESKVLLSAFSAFWPILIQTIYGVRDVEPLSVDTARSFGFSGFDRLRWVVLPAALPYVMTGLRLGLALALIVVVTMEIVVGIPGIGQEMVEARQAAAVPNVYAMIFVVGLLGVAQNVLFLRGEARLLHWHASHRGGTPA